MKVLYQIWLVKHNINKPVPKDHYSRFIKEESGNWAYPLIQFINVLPSRCSRDDIRSLDRDRLEEHCKYLNELKDENEHYEVREVPPEP